MHRKVTITLSHDVYEGLQRKVGRERMSALKEDLVRAHFLSAPILEEQYHAMAADREREQQAMEWIESLAGAALE